MFVVGIAGPSASGKSALAHNLMSEFNPKRFFVMSADNYYKDYRSTPLEERAVMNFDHPDTMDHDLMVSHIKSLRNGEFVDMPVYIHGDYARSEKTVRIGGINLLVIEGFLLFTDARLRELMDIKIYVDTPLDLCLSRKMIRDVLSRGRTVEAVLENYESMVRPMFFEFIEPSKQYANLIVPMGGRNKIAIEVIKARFKEILREMKEKK